MQTVLQLTVVPGMWIHMRDQNVILGRNAVSTDGAQALLRQDHADRKFMIGGLGNKQLAST